LGVAKIGWTSGFSRRTPAEAGPSLLSPDSFQPDPKRVSENSYPQTSEVLTRQFRLTNWSQKVAIWLLQSRFVDLGGLPHPFFGRALTAFLCAVAILLVACARPTTTFTSPPPTNLPPTSLPPTSLPPINLSPTAPPVYPLILRADLGPVALARLEADVTAFAADHPAVPIRVVSPLGEEKARPEDADVMLVNRETLRSLWEQEAICPADTLFSASFLAEFAPPLLENATASGHLWAVPHSAGLYLLLFYRPSLLAESPADTAALLKLSSRFRSAPPWGLGMNAADPLWLIPWLSGYGAWPDLDASRTAPALRFLLTLRDRYGLLAPVSDYDTTRELFLQGKIAMFVDGPWLLEALRDDQDWAMTLLPVVKETGFPLGPLVGGRYLAVSCTLTGRRRAVVRELIAHLVSRETQLLWMREVSELPASAAALSDPAVQEDPLWRTLAAQMLNGRGAPLDMDVTALLEAMRGPLEALWQGEMTPEEVAAAIDQLAR